MTHRIITGDCIEGMSILDAGSVQTCVTSPPYYGLRDYGVTGQLGMESTLDEYVERMVSVFRSVKRILREDGTLWLNLGDSYNGSGGNHKPHHKNDTGFQGKPGAEQHSGRGTRIRAIAHKNLCGIPWRVAFALQADGWCLRQDIIWQKPNPMPESVTDRCTKSHEYIFLLSKKPHYYFDNEAIREPAVYAGKMRGGSTNRYEQNAAGMDNKQYDTRNKRSVWAVNTKPFKGAHFAVYPEKLIEPCVLAGTSEHGCCSKCGAPWERQIESTRIARNELPPEDPRYRPNTYKGVYGEINGRGDAGFTSTKTLGWEPSCKCKDTKVVPCTVFDPFTGSGTTAVVSLKHGRNFVGTELNPEYVALAESRISSAARSDTTLVRKCGNFEPDGSWW